MIIRKRKLIIDVLCGRDALLRITDIYPGKIDRSFHRENCCSITTVWSHGQDSDYSE